MPKYQIDDATFDHLNSWCDSALTDERRDAARERILAYLAECDIEDAAYSLSHGWWHIYDLVTEA